MTGKTFVDTNILIYAHDIDAGDKHGIARDALLQLWDTGSGALSTQVLQEFYVNVTRKLRHPMSKAEARATVNDFFPWCEQMLSEDIEIAFRMEDEARIGFWDALIVASALRSGATRILSEDLNHGQTIAGVRIENPFLPPPAKSRR